MSSLWFEELEGRITSDRPWDYPLLVVDCYSSSNKVDFISNFTVDDGLAFDWPVFLCNKKAKESYLNSILEPKVVFFDCTSTGFGDGRLSGILLNELHTGIITLSRHGYGAVKTNPVKVVVFVDEIPISRVGGYDYDVMVLLPNGTYEIGYLDSKGDYLAIKD